MLTFYNLTNNIFDFCDEKTKINVFISFLNSSKTNSKIIYDLIKYFKFKRYGKNKNNYTIKVPYFLKTKKNKIRDKKEILLMLKPTMKSPKSFIYSDIDKYTNFYFIKKGEGYLTFVEIHKTPDYLDAFISYKYYKINILEGDIKSKHIKYLNEIDKNKDDFFSYEIRQFNENQSDLDFPYQNLKLNKNLKKIQITFLCRNFNSDNKLKIIFDENINLNYFSCKLAYYKNTEIFFSSKQKIKAKTFYYNCENYQIKDRFETDKFVVLYNDFLNYYGYRTDRDVTTKQKNIKTIFIIFRNNNITENIILKIFNCFEDLETVNFFLKKNNTVILQKMLNIIENLEMKNINFIYNKKTYKLK